MCCICTGRCLSSALDTDIVNYSWDGYICTSGQEILDKDFKVIQRDFMPEDTVVKIIKRAEEVNVPLVLVTEEGMKLIGKRNKYVDKCREFLNLKIGKTEEYNGENILYIMAFAKEEYDYADFKEFDIEIENSYMPYADLVIKGVNKVNGIRRFMEVNGLKHFMAFGDALADLRMIKEADTGVAMGQGDKSLFEYADYITEPLNKDGLAKILKELRSGK